VIFKDLQKLVQSQEQQPSLDKMRKLIDRIRKEADIMDKLQSSS
jgi:hypothetical protein